MSGSYPVLEVIQEPELNFYKDEGGKSNFLVMHVVCRNLTQSLPLKISLHYESGQIVEERDQGILNLLGNQYEPYVLTKSTPTANIEFRLEKVSRRKDGQRFRIRVEPAPPGYVRGTEPHPGYVDSRAICVMSKRKTGERITTRRAKPSTGALSVEATQILKDLSRQIADAVATLSSGLREHSVRLSAIEEKLDELVSSGPPATQFAFTDNLSVLGDLPAFLQPTEAGGPVSGTTPAATPGASGVQRLPSRTTAPLITMADVSGSGGGGATSGTGGSRMNLKRLQSREFTFDWGLPSETESTIGDGGGGGGGGGGSSGTTVRPPATRRVSRRTSNMTAGESRRKGRLSVVHAETTGGKQLLGLGVSPGVEIGPVLSQMSAQYGGTISSAMAKGDSAVSRAASGTTSIPPPAASLSARRRSSRLSATLM